MYVSGSAFRVAKSSHIIAPRTREIKRQGDPSHLLSSTASPHSWAASSAVAACELPPATAQPSRRPQKSVPPPGAEPSGESSSEEPRRLQLCVTGREVLFPRESGGERVAKEHR